MAKLHQSRAADTVALGIFSEPTLNLPAPGAPEVLERGGPYGMGCAPCAAAMGCSGCGGKCGGGMGGPDFAAPRPRTVYGGPRRYPDWVDPVPQTDYVRHRPTLVKGGMHGDDTSVLYKFGMSPKLWALVAAGVGGYFYFKKRRR